MENPARPRASSSTRFLAAVDKGPTVSPDPQTPPNARDIKAFFAQFHSYRPDSAPASSWGPCYMRRLCWWTRDLSPSLGTQTQDDQVASRTSGPGTSLLLVIQSSWLYSGLSPSPAHFILTPGLPGDFPAAGQGHLASEGPLSRNHSGQPLIPLPDQAAGPSLPVHTSPGNSFYYCNRAQISRQGPRGFWADL